MGTVRIAHLSDLHFVPGKQYAQVGHPVRDFNEGSPPACWPGLILCHGTQGIQTV